MKTIEQIREEANKLYNGKYEYLDIDRSANKSKIIIKCNEHGIFLKYYVMKIFICLLLYINKSL
jgi:hypothetical protein